MNKKSFIIVTIFLILISIVLFILLKDNLNPNNEQQIEETNQTNEENSNEQNNEETNNEENNQEGDEMNEFVSTITMTINDNQYVITLEDNQTAREFINKLPLTITMNDLNSNEKYYYFDDSLSTNSERIGTIQNGDLMLFGNDCLVLFYETFNSSYSYTRIGKIDNPSSLKDTVGSGSITISFTK